jgi:long-chain acyl-CoA synthetase
MASWYAALASGGCAFLAAPGTDPLQALWLGRPSIVVGFDRDVAALAVRARAEAAGMPGWAGRLVRWGLNERARHRSASSWGRVRRALADEASLPRLKEILGGSLRHAVVGFGQPGAASRSLAAFGCEVLEAYGLAEASGIVTLQRPGAEGPGIPLEGVSVSIADSGEIRVSGCGVMVPHAALRPGSDVVFEDGRLCTGDLGRLEPDGSLVVTGRVERGAV